MFTLLFATFSPDRTLTKSKNIAMIRAARVTEDSSFILKKKIEKKRQSCDVVIASFAITVVRWNNEKIVNVLSTFADKEPTQKVEQCCRKTE